MLMRGVIPVFVSCKNGAVDSNELYKLNTVADRFGSIYAKKIIAATYLGKMGFRKGNGSVPQTCGRDGH